ncbi:MAG TPA: hypothetical protein VJT15_17780 [Pyrinomonadaceae bacterium]|nr:hypothetical protein [Pyrinomonadaceae bacterium]
MNKIKTFLTMGATVAMLAIPVAAQNTAAPASASAPQDGCTQEAKDANYKLFRETLKTDQPKANEAAKKYLACPASATPTEGETKIVEYLKRWTKLYEEGSKKIKLTTLLYTDKKYEEAFTLGREILAAEPEYIKGIVDLGANGYLVAPLKNDQLTNEAIAYARKALQLLDSGKTLEDWGHLQNKDVATAYLNYTIGTLTVAKDPGGALKHLIKSAQFQTPLKDSAFTYAFIAGAYETGPYAQQSADYKARYSGKDETPESKLALANINQLVDRMIDGYARAVKLATAEMSAEKAAWQENLTNLYKYRHESDAGLNEMIAGILAKPLPPEPTPITVLPAAPPATPAGTSGGATPGVGAGNGAPAGNGAAAAPAKTTTTPATANTKPADKPRPRR